METFVKFWWDEKKDVHSSLFKHVNLLKEKQSENEELRKRHLKLYGNLSHMGYSNDLFNSPKNHNKLTLNVVQIACDTAQARIAKTLPKARFLTDDGNYKLQLQAKNLERFIDGIYYQNDLHQKAQEVFLDSEIFGDGAIKFYICNQNGKPCVKAERAFLMDLLVDTDEAMYGNPKQLYQIKYVNKHVFADMHPKYKEKILASKSPDVGFFDMGLDHGTIMVVEGWKLPTNGKPGRHIIATDSVAIVDEPWTMTSFPFEFFSFKKRPIGFWSTGIAELLTGIQFEINKLLKTIQMCTHLGSIPKLYVEAGSGIVKQHLNNQIGGIITYSGTRPVSEALMRIPPELLSQLENYYYKAFEIIGLSEMAIAGSRPAGLNSGKAIREFHSTESERFAIISQNYENFHMRIAKKIIQFSDYVFEQDKKFSVLTLDRNGTKNIYWKDVNLDSDSYIMKAYPVNLLSETPAGKLEDVQNLFATGLIDRQQAMNLLDFPDVESIVSLENAQMENIKAVISDIIENGIYHAPDPLQDLELGIKLCNAAYLKYKRMDLEDEKLEMLSMWVEDAISLLSPPQPQLDEEDMLAMEEMQMMNQQQNIGEI